MLSSTVRLQGLPYFCVLVLMFMTSLFIILLQVFGEAGLRCLTLADFSCTLNISIYMYVHRMSNEAIGLDHIALIMWWFMPPDGRLLIFSKSFLAARRACYLIYAPKRCKVLLSSLDPQELFWTLLAYSCLWNAGGYLLLENSFRVHPKFFYLSVCIFLCLPYFWSSFSFSCRP